MFVKTTDKDGAPIVVDNGAKITSFNTRGDAYGIVFKLSNGKVATGWRGKSLGIPVLGPCTAYVKKDAYDERGNSGTWNVGFTVADTFNPFE